MIEDIATTVQLKFRNLIFVDAWVPEFLRISEACAWHLREKNEQ